MGTSIFLRLMVTIAIFTNRSKAYITYKLNDIHAYQYPSVGSELGIPFMDKYYTANLYIAPSSNMNMCKHTNLTDTQIESYSSDDFRRNLDATNNPIGEISMMSQSTPDHYSLTQIKTMASRFKRSKSSANRKLQQSQSLPLALLINGGGCTLADKARMVTELNENYKIPGGPKIDFLVVVRDNSIIPPPREEDLDFRITYIDAVPGESLMSLIKQIYVIRMPPGASDYYLNPRSFLPTTDTSLDDWYFYVIIDDMNFSFPYAFILYVFMGLIIGVPLMRYFVLVVMNRGFRWRRDENGRVNGVTFSRMHRRFRESHHRDWHVRTGTEEGSIFFNAWREIENRLTLGKLTEEEIKALPTIEYNVSDIEEINRQYNNENVDSQVNGSTKIGDYNTEDVAKVSNDNEGVKTGNANNGTSSFLQNAFTSFPSCSICIDDFEQGEKLIMLPACGHFFHPQCISTWLKDTRGTCPLCQIKVSPPDSSRSEGTDARTGSTAGIMGLNASIQSIADRGRTIIFIRESSESNALVSGNRQLDEIQEAQTPAPASENGVRSSGNVTSNEDTAAESNGGNGNNTRSTNEESTI